MSLRVTGEGLLLSVTFNDMREWWSKNWQYLFSLIIALFSAWYAFDRRISLLESVVVTQQKQIDTIQTDSKEFVTKRELDQNITPRLDRIEGKLDTVIDKGVK